ncbi:DUF4913 domain-containing protein [Rathayibacter caricis]|uniref:DUF4913 domain-containing protein n=1 Tax=Rathayibacter caricis TaxID=110936 RepID=UPI001B87CFEA|nr:DUF4913 domain-containing protein [Rathayibacter caricis]
MDDAFGFDQPEDPSDAIAAEPEPELFYPTLDDFVREHVRFKYRRLVGRAGRADLRWKAAWWESEEALSRLKTLWRGWENARQDPIKMGDWWLNQFDRHMAVLLSSAGPFATSQDENKPGDPLPYTPPPPGFFPPADPAWS